MLLFQSMESEQANSKPIENNEEEIEEEIEEDQEKEEGNEKNNINILVKEEKVEKDDPTQEIKMAENKPEDDEKEEEAEREGKEEEEIEGQNKARNEGKKDRDNEAETELKIKKNDEHLEEENNFKEDKESPIEESGDKDNEEISKGSKENVEEYHEHEQSKDRKEEILKIEKCDVKVGGGCFNLKGIEISTIYTEDKDNINIYFQKSCFSPELILHWGLFKEYPINGWHHPSKENYPRKTKEFDAFPLHSEFEFDYDDREHLAIELELPKKDTKGISFVFYNPNMNEWYNNNWRDFQIFFSN